jgi:hypothetical protein
MSRSTNRIQRTTIAAAVGCIVSLAGSAHAGVPQTFTYTLTCFQPGTLGGAVTLGTKSNGLPLTEKGVDISGGASATDKCGAIAAAFPSAAAASGNTITFTVQTPYLAVVDDTTHESNSVTAFPPEGSRVRLVVVPTLDPHLVPPAGTTFTGALLSDAFTPFTFFVAADGQADATDLLGQMMTKMTTHTGLNFTPVIIPTGPTSSLSTWESDPFDPPSANIFWDANTSTDLANFGFEVVPEPSLPLALGTAWILVFALSRGSERWGRAARRCA